MPACSAEQAETLHDFMLDWFRLDAGPELATATAISYLHVYNKHLRPLAGHRPLEQFELPGPVTEVLGQMAAAGVGQATRDNARKVLSSAFGWGVETGRMRANGVRSLRRNRRRSRRLAAAEVQPVRRREAAARRKAWAISPEAFAALHRGALDRRTPGRPLWMPARDAIAMSMLYGLGLRPQELFGATFRQVSRSRFRVAQVLTKGRPEAGSTRPVGRIIAAAKTAEGVRTMPMRSWLYDELRRVASVPEERRPARRRRRLHHSRAPRPMVTTRWSSSTTSSATSRRAVELPPGAIRRCRS